MEAEELAASFESLVIAAADLRILEWNAELFNGGEKRSTVFEDRSFIKIYPQHSVVSVDDVGGAKSGHAAL